MTIFKHTVVKHMDDLYIDVQYVQHIRFLHGCPAQEHPSHWCQRVDGRQNINVQHLYV